MQPTRNLLSAVALSVCSMGAMAATNLVSNGSFETLTIANPVGGYVQVNALSTVITGWTVGGISVDVINGAHGAISGNSIDMVGTPGPGELSQVLSTVPSQQYLVSFDLFRNGGSSNSIDLEFGASPSANFVSAGASFTHYDVLYTASSASTTLRFFNNDPGYAGAVLDNVSVTAVPEPETYAMLLAGLGVMGTIARRRRMAKPAA